MPTTTDINMVLTYAKNAFITIKVKKPQSKLIWIADSLLLRSTAA